MDISREIITMIENEKTGVAPVEQTSNLYTDLGFDSLGFIRLLLKIEEKYSITFNLLEMELCLEINRLVSIVKNKLEEGKGD